MLLAVPSLVLGVMGAHALSPRSDSKPEAGPGSGKTYLRAYPYAFSHLSPLITYFPASAWNITAHEARSVASNASMSLSFLGDVLIVNGEQHGARVESQPPIPPLRPRSGYKNYELVEDGKGQMGEMFSMVGAEMSVEMRNFSLELDDEAQRADGVEPYMAVSQVQLFTEIPALAEEHTQDVTRQSAVEAHKTPNPFFTDARGAWDVIQLPKDVFRPVPPIPSVWFFEQFQPAFPTSAVLSTNTTHAPLHFAVPPHTEFLQWYGTVGPDQGAFELRLQPQGNVTDFELDRRVYAASAHRAISSARELRMVAYLDPRVEYHAELVLVQEGKRADVHGVFFTSYVRDAAKLEAPWYRLHNVARGYCRPEMWYRGPVASAVVAVLFCVGVVGLAMWWFSRVLRRDTEREEADADARAEAKAQADAEEGLGEAPSTAASESGQDARGREENAGPSVARATSGSASGEREPLLAAQRRDRAV